MSKIFDNLNNNKLSKVEKALSEMLDAKKQELLANVTKEAGNKLFEQSVHQNGTITPELKKEIQNQYNIAKKTKTLGVYLGKLEFYKDHFTYLFDGKVFTGILVTPQGKFNRYEDIGDDFNEDPHNQKHKMSASYNSAKEYFKWLEKYVKSWFSSDELFEAFDEDALFEGAVWKHNPEHGLKHSVMKNTKTNKFHAVSQDGYGYHVVHKEGHDTPEKAFEHSKRLHNIKTSKIHILTLSTNKHKNYHPTTPSKPSKYTRGHGTNDTSVSFKKHKF